MPHKYALQFRDWSDEKSSAEIYTGAITALTIAGLLVEIGTLRGATEAITLGVAAKERIIMDDTLISAARPVSEFAQREIKWLVTYKGDTSNKIHNLEIPTADPTGRLIPGTDRADLTEASMAAWVAAFEQTARTPDSDIEPVTVQYITLVGRNL